MKNKLGLSCFVLLLTIIPMTVAMAQAKVRISEGCLEISEYPTGMYNWYDPPARQFFAGELITVTSSEPHSSGTPTTTELLVDHSTVATDGFPGTVSYQIPSDMVVALGWKVDSGNVTFNPSCVPGEAPSTAIPVFGSGGAAILVILLMAAAYTRRKNRAA